MYNLIKYQKSITSQPNTKNSIPLPSHEEPLGRLHAGQVQDCHEHAAGPLSEGMHAVCAAA